MIVVKRLNGLEKVIVCHCWLAMSHFCLTNAWSFRLFAVNLIVLVLKRLHFSLVEHILSIYRSFEH